MKFKYAIIFCLIGALVVCVFALNKETPQNPQDLGGPSQTGTRVQTATETTSPNYMTPGTATTTLTFNSTTQGDRALPDELNLYLQSTASTSATVWEWKYQYSMNNIDWFDEDMQTPSALTPGLDTYEHASTTITHRWNPGSTTASTTRKIFDVPTYGARYIRAVIGIGIGTANGSLWAELVPIKQVK